MCSVQSKLPCIFKTQVLACDSTKRKEQNYKVVASKIVSKDAISSHSLVAKITEKIDGTCCYVDKYNDTTCLWARLDRKPKKGILKKFQQFQKLHNAWRFNKQGNEPTFGWVYPDNMKEVPVSWKPALNVNRDIGGRIIPDLNGHVPGWVPICTDTKQYCWHTAAVSNDFALALKQTDGVLSLTVARLADLTGKTLELIGTNVNNNPYKLGNKQKPFHVLVEHGEIGALYSANEIVFNELKSWFSSDMPESNVEGIVWHCSDGNMFKLHRHHLDLPWPKSSKDQGDNKSLDLPYLSTRCVKVDSSLLQGCEENLTLFWTSVKKLHLKTFNSLYQLSNLDY